MIKFLFIILLFSGLTSFSQTIISGKLLDQLSMPIANASVAYKKVGSGSIIGFSKSDKDGQFVANVTITLADSVQFDFNHMSYAKKSVIVANKTANYTFTLDFQVRQLDEVKIKDNPITQRKDTINYKLESFITPQDRVIGDIIKKLPGIEMEGNKILYQGKPIQKYMVNNLDLMEGRYALINNNMPADAVKSVQVIENDQPIKILDSLVFSDRASLNLVLKKFTTTGTGNVGAGISPALWDIKLTPMTFGRTFQMVNSFQTNNTGNDVSRELRNLTTNGLFLGGITSIIDGPTYLSLRDVSSPNFEERKWLQNKIFLGSANALQKLKDGLELKANVSYYDDTRIRQGFTATQYLTNDDVILTSETVDNRYRINVLDGGLTLEKNDKKIYLRNYFKFHKRWNSDLGNIYFNASDSIFQQRNYTDEAILNSLSFAKFLGKQLVNVQSTIEYHNTPQRLSVTPGQFQDILNNEKPYEQLTQDVLFKSLRWNNSLSFLRKYREWKLTPYIGFNYDRSNLDTHIALADQGTSIKLGDGYINDMLSNELDLNLKIDAALDLNKWNLGFSVPYDLYNFNIRQGSVKTLDNVLRHTFNPSMRINYKSVSRSSFNAGLSAGNTFGELDDFYSGFIVNQYRTINRYESRLLQTNRINGNLGYAYKNTLKSRFANLRYSYSFNRRDYIFTTLVDALGRITTGIADRNSNSSSHNITGDISQYLLPIKTMVKLNGNMGWTESDLLFNAVMNKRSLFRYSGTFEVISNASKYVSGEFKSTYGEHINKIPGRNENRLWFNNYFLTLNFSARKHQSLHLYNSYYINNIAGQKNQLFLDLNYRFRLSKWKTTLELTVYNLLDNNEYAQQTLSSVHLVQTFFELRPRQFMLSTSFKF